MESTLCAHSLTSIIIGKTFNCVDISFIDKNTFVSIKIAMWIFAVFINCFFLIKQSKRRCWYFNISLILMLNVHMRIFVSNFSTSLPVLTQNCMLSGLFSKWVRQALCGVGMVSRRLRHRTGCRLAVRLVKSSFPGHNERQGVIDGAARGAHVRRRRPGVSGVLY